MLSNILKKFVGFIIFIFKVLISLLMIVLYKLIRLPFKLVYKLFIFLIAYIFMNSYFLMICFFIDYNLIEVWCYFVTKGKDFIDFTEVCVVGDFRLFTSFFTFISIFFAAPIIVSNYLLSFYPNEFVVPFGNFWEFLEEELLGLLICFFFVHNVLTYLYAMVFIEVYKAFYYLSFCKYYVYIVIFFRYIVLLYYFYNNEMSTCLYLYDKFIYSDDFNDFIYFWYNEIFYLICEFLGRLLCYCNI